MTYIISLPVLKLRQIGPDFNPGFVGNSSPNLRPGFSENYKIIIRRFVCDLRNESSGGHTRLWAFP